MFTFMHDIKERITGTSYSSNITLINRTGYTINFRIVGGEGTNQNFILEPDSAQNINISTIKTISKFTAGSEASTLTAKMHGCHPPVPSLNDKVQYVKGWIVDIQKGTNVDGEPNYIYRRNDDSRPLDDSLIEEFWIGSTYPLSSFVQHTLEVAYKTAKQSPTNKNISR